MNNDVKEAITTRRSVRYYSSKPVEKDIIEDILKVASRAPSGTNIQPWNVHVLMGEPLKQFTDKAVEIFFDDNLVKKNERVHYMEKFREPYLARRRKVGWDLYNLLGIKKGDYEKTKNFHSQNFKFFSAPVGMIFTIEKRPRLDELVRLRDVYSKYLYCCSRIWFAYLSSSGLGTNE